MASESSKKVAYNIARHLQSQVSSGILSEDDKEGIDGTLSETSCRVC